MTTTEGSTVTAEDLRDFLDGRVARWWLPEHWVFAEAIPRTSVASTTSGCCAASTPRAS